MFKAGCWIELCGDRNFRSPLNNEMDKDMISAKYGDAFF
jgi:hypothetical protein